jgi:hypothetical protein
MTRDIPSILRLGAGEDLVRYFQATESMVEIHRKWLDSGCEDCNYQDQFSDAFHEAERLLIVVYDGHPGPKETEAEKRLKELRNP